MRVLKKKVQKAGIVKELRQRQYYEKPSDKRVRKKKEMAKNWKKKQAKLLKMRGYQIFAYIYYTRQFVRPSDKRNGRRYQILKIKYGVADVFQGTVPCGSSSKKRT